MVNEAYNAPAAGVPFFTPKHAVSPGTPLDPKSKVPTLFTPLHVRGVTMRNRIIVVGGTKLIAVVEDGYRLLCTGIC